MSNHRRTLQRGRGAVSNPNNRYADHRREAVDDGWYQEASEPLRTELAVDTSRTIISRNRSPDVPFERSINPYRGCEHGCISCYARPTHAWLWLSPGLDFERRLFYKPDAAEQLERELARRPGHTDPRPSCSVPSRTRTSRSSAGSGLPGKCWRYSTPAAIRWR